MTDQYAREDEGEYTRADDDGIEIPEDLQNLCERLRSLVVEKGLQPPRNMGELLAPEQQSAWRVAFANYLHLLVAANAIDDVTVRAYLFLIDVSKALAPKEIMRTFGPGGVHDLGVEAFSTWFASEEQFAEKKKTLVAAATVMVNPYYAKFLNLALTDLPGPEISSSTVSSTTSPPTYSAVWTAITGEAATVHRDSFLSLREVLRQQMAKEGSAPPRNVVELVAAKEQPEWRNGFEVYLRIHGECEIDDSVREAIGGYRLLVDLNHAGSTEEMLQLAKDRAKDGNAEAIFSKWLGSEEDFEENREKLLGAASAMADPFYRDFVNIVLADLPIPQKPNSSSANQPSHDQPASTNAPAPRAARGREHLIAMTNGQVTYGYILRKSGFVKKQQLIVGDMDDFPVGAKFSITKKKPAGSMTATFVISKSELLDENDRAFVAQTFEDYPLTLRWV